MLSVRPSSLSESDARLEGSKAACYDIRAEEESLSKGLKAKDVRNSCQPAGGIDGGPWPTNFVRSAEASLNFASEFQHVVDSSADERPIQKWLEANPAALVLRLGAVNGWVFGRPRLGAEFVPDFMSCTWDSRGYHWSLLELENPKFSPLTQEGGQSARLTHAIQQILDWRIWLRANIQYAQQELGFRDLDAGFRAHVVIGRRRTLDSREPLRYRELSRDDLEVMTYDRLIERLVKNLRLSP
jgi:hypothetical protein